MDSRIELWERKFRLQGPSARQRLESLAGGAVLSAYEKALQRAFGDDPEMVLVREVKLIFTANLGTLDEGVLARRWGEEMADAVLRAVADGEVANLNSSDLNRTAAVVRYSDASAHLAAFVADVAAGRSTARAWYFARFARYLRPTPSETVRESLLAHKALTPEVFRRLATTRDLGRVVALLDPPTAARLWSAGPAGGVGGGAGLGAESLRPIFAAALAAIGRLEGSGPDRAQAETWLTQFAAGWSAPVDWRDRGSLAQAVLAAVRFLIHCEP